LFLRNVIGSGDPFLPRLDLIPLFFFFLLLELLKMFFVSEPIVIFFLCNWLLPETSTLLSITTVGLVTLLIPNSITVVSVKEGEPKGEGGIGDPGRSNISFSVSDSLSSSSSSTSSTILIKFVPLDTVLIGESDLRLLGLVLFTPSVVIAVLGIFSSLSCFFFDPSGLLEEGSGGTGGNFPHCALDRDLIVFGIFLIVVVHSFSFTSLSWSLS